MISFGTEKTEKFCANGRGHGTANLHQNSFVHPYFCFSKCKFHDLLVVSRYKNYIKRTDNRAPFSYLPRGLQAKTTFLYPKIRCSFVAKVSEVKARLRIINSSDNIDQSLKILAP